MGGSRFDMIQAQTPLIVLDTTEVMWRCAQCGYTDVRLTSNPPSGWFMVRWLIRDDLWSECYVHNRVCMQKFRRRTDSLRRQLEMAESLVK